VVSTEVEFCLRLSTPSPCFLTGDYLSLRVPKPARGKHIFQNKAIHLLFYISPHAFISCGDRDGMSFGKSTGEGQAYQGCASIKQYQQAKICLYLTSLQEGFPDFGGT
jgi:hypothetical protein